MYVRPYYTSRNMGSSTGRKATYPPSQRVLHLVVVIDTVQDRVLLSQEKILSSIQELTSRSHIEVMFLARLLGVMVSS